MKQIKKARSSDIRFKLPAFLEQVKEGNVIEVLVYNRPVGYLISPEDFILLKSIKEDFE